MIISHEHKFIFFKPMKVAGSSIEVALAKTCGEKDLQTGSEYSEEIEEYDYVPKNNELVYHSHTSPTLLYRRSAKKWEDYYKVTVVRNPWDMIISYYWWSFNSPASIRSTAPKPLETIGHQLWAPQTNDENTDISSKFQGYLEQMAFFRGTPYGDEGPIRVIKWLAKRQCHIVIIMMIILHFLSERNFAQSLIILGMNFNQDLSQQLLYLTVSPAQSI
jgi:hypothetical protein